MEPISPEPPRTFLQLVDIIFGVIIGATLVSLATELVPIKLDLFDTWAIYVAFLIILLSWIFYHKAVHEQKLELNKLIIFDLILLFLYFYILFSFNNFPHYVFATCIMFGVYLTWTIIRDSMKKNSSQSLINYYKSDKKHQLKLGRSIGIFVASVILLFLHNHFTTPNYSEITPGDGGVDGVVLLVIAFLAVMYRVIPYFSKSP